ncbi:potassium-transporting ATPase subunit KdpA [uncultured Megasphaera sp.]|uniref:potassium-transporting ATPase subunit KdpA n=1 Tax=uncultured Megasphaera sp. TaxID=165188 RepID=UPI00265A2DC9|nr:potassium-transporting ATPase subunit KdpA [uncultured Megasphaera sp.]
MSAVAQYIVFLVVLVVLAIPLGKYMANAMDGKRVFLSPILSPLESLIYKVTGVQKDEDMGWKTYFVSVVWFFTIGLLFLFFFQIFQDKLPFNPQNIEPMSWHLSFNTAASFATNTNWQAYSGESALSYFSQFMGLTTQNFVSAATGIAVMWAMIRAFIRAKEKGLGNFWVDLTRATVYILLPLSFVVSIVLFSQGVVQNFSPAQTARLVEPVAADADGKWIEDAQIDLNTNTVTVDGQVVPDATIITEQFIPMGPGASQVAIKQLGTNGGGFMGVNSAHPLENPNALTNIFECIALLLIPAGLCFSFGISIKNKKQGRAIFLAMFIMLVAFLAIVGYNEQVATPQLAHQNQIDIVASDTQPGGNMEGKESRFGIAQSSTWATFTTAASNGSVNSMHDSYTPLGGLVEMLQMELGEVVFGGVGCGFYGMIGFAVLTVFIAGLMVGRTPEFLSKKIEPYEMKWAVLVCLATPIGILIASGIAAVWPGVDESLTNSGAHGFSELLYAYSSAGGNNGSAFAGFNANTPFLNVTIGLTMIFVRLLPILGILAMSGSLVQKKKIAVTAGTLSTTNTMFVFLLIFIVILVGALNFFPALSLGPVAEYFSMHM